MVDTLRLCARRLVASPDHNPEGVRIRVGATHRKLSTVVNTLVDAGLEAERFVEPPAPIPTYLLWRCRRANGPPRQPGPSGRGSFAGDRMSARTCGIVPSCSTVVMGQGGWHDVA